MAGALPPLAAGALIFGLLQGGVAWAWWSPPSVAVFAVAAAATAAAVVGSAGRRADRPAVVLAPPGAGRVRLPRSGLGLLVTGPSILLPTYGQAVLGLGAVAAGAVLATMSIGWPLASAVPGGSSCAWGSATPS